MTTSYTGTRSATNLVHTEEGLTFIWPGGHVPILVKKGEQEIGQINMSVEIQDMTLENGTGTLEEHMHVFRLIIGVFIGNHVDPTAGLS